MLVAIRYYIRFHGSGADPLFMPVSTVHNFPKRSNPARYDRITNVHRQNAGEGSSLPHQRQKPHRCFRTGKKDTKFCQWLQTGNIMKNADGIFLSYLRWGSGGRRTL